MRCEHPSARKGSKCASGQVERCHMCQIPLCEDHRSKFGIYMYCVGPQGCRAKVWYAECYLKPALRDVHFNLLNILRDWFTRDVQPYLGRIFGRSEN